MNRTKRGNGDGNAPLHPLEFRILLVCRDAPIHGYRIVKEVEERTEGSETIHPANLYRRIRNLVNRGLIVEVTPPSEPSGDRPRKYFQITGAGRRIVATEVTRLRSLLAEATGAV